MPFFLADDYERILPRQLKLAPRRRAPTQKLSRINSPLWRIEDAQMETRFLQIMSEKLKVSYFFLSLLTLSRNVIFLSQIREHSYSLEQSKEIKNMISPLESS